MSPQDLEGAQSLTFHYAADMTNQKGWAYDPQSRRTRSIVVNHQSSSFEANFLIEDHAGFQGYLHNYTWKHLGEQVMLMPGFRRRNTPRSMAAKAAGIPSRRGSCARSSFWKPPPTMPAIRTACDAFILTGRFIRSFASVVYDREGNHWRTLFHTFGDPADDPDNAEVKGTHLHLGNVWIDYKSNRAALWTADEILINKPLKPRKFTVKEMVRLGK